MDTVCVRGVVIGEGMPKICAPIVEKTEKKIWEAAEEIAHSAADMAEWRIDWFEGFANAAAVEAALKGLRTALGDMPLLATFRTAQEGGEVAVSSERYAELYREIITGGCADLIDIELSAGAEAVGELTALARSAGVKVVLSSHDFQSTPDESEILSRIHTMWELGADIAKIAVMPRDVRDVLTLLSATARLGGKAEDREEDSRPAGGPIITMVMGGIGAVSRLAGEIFGSAVTFGSAGAISAPGQMEVKELRAALEMLHRGLEKDR